MKSFQCPFVLKMIFKGNCHFYSSLDSENMLKMSKPRQADVCPQEWKEEM